MTIPDLSPLALSIRVAMLSTLLAAVTGVALARYMGQREFPGKSAAEALILLPIVLPPTVVGFGLVMLFGVNGPIGRLLEDWFGIRVVFTWVGAVIASFVVSLPLMYQSVQAAFEKVDPRWENVARTMGVSEWRIFRKVTFPLAWPGILAGLVLAFARGLGEFGGTLMIAGFIPGETVTVPLAIYFSYEAGRTGEAMFWVVLITLLGLAAITWLNGWRRKTSRRRGRE